VNWFRAFWLFWLAVGFVVEMVALRRKAKEDTASETYWWLRGPKLNSWRAAWLGLFLLWAFAHLEFKLFA
jgi:hypothetical protein